MKDGFIENGFGGFIAGVCFALFFFFLLWVKWDGVMITTDGKFYIKTHIKIYQLISDKPVKIITSLTNPNNQ